MSCTAHTRGPSDSVYMWSNIYECFFFQAEDGIRDYKVTGVQTCALPISFGGVACEGLARISQFAGKVFVLICSNVVYSGVRGCLPALLDEIGRASCRERV